LYNGESFRGAPDKERNVPCKDVDFAGRSDGDGVANLKFEEALSRLEEAVKSLEKGDLPLEESLRVFEEGVRLSKNCLKMLDEAEKKVEILIQDKDGKRKLRPFEMKGDPSAGESSSPGTERRSHG
jgi:exodeoxyribonuclease VII small subunit